MIDNIPDEIPHFVYNRQVIDKEFNRTQKVENIYVCVVGALFTLMMGGMLYILFASSMEIPALSTVKPKSKNPSRIQEIIYEDSGALNIPEIKSIDCGWKKC